VKEIGIRKVLGASVANITAMLSKDFLLLVVVSLVIASPIAWYAMNKWLQDYAYRINNSMVGICGRRDNGCHYCFYNYKLASHQSCIGKSGGEFEERVGVSWQFVVAVCS